MRKRWLKHCNDIIGKGFQRKYIFISLMNAVGYMQNVEKDSMRTSNRGRDWRQNKQSTKASQRQVGILPRSERESRMKPQPYTDKSWKNENDME